VPAIVKENYLWALGSTVLGSRGARILLPNINTLRKTDLGSTVCDMSKRRFLLFDQLEKGQDRVK